MELCWISEIKKVGVQPSGDIKKLFKPLAYYVNLHIMREGIPYGWRANGKDQGLIFVLTLGIQRR